MMPTYPQLRLLSILAVLFALAQANWFDANIFNKRQGIESIVSGILSDVGITSSSSPSSVNTTPSSTSPATTSATPTTDSSPVVSSPSSTPPTSTTPTPTSTPVTSSPSSTPSPDSSTSSTETSSSSEDASSSRLTTSLSRSVHVATSIVVITTDGSTISSTMLSSSTSTSTSVASLSGGGSNGSKGMSSSTRNTIIGVCVGVGGAALLGALAFVIFRLRKSRRGQDESDGLMGFRTDVDSRQEKTSSSGAPNQFQSTLESYHAPARNANVSSNF